MRILEKLWSKVYLFLLKRRGMMVSGKVGLRYGVDIPRLARKISMGNFVNLDRNVSLVITETPENMDKSHLLIFGDNVYINRNTSIDVTTEITIGSNTMIGPNCYITDHDHNYKGFSATTPISKLPLTGAITVIGENVWIGANVVVLKGVTIGSNSIIGAGSVVTKSIPTGVIAVGSPCKMLLKR